MKKNTGNWANMDAMIKAKAQICPATDEQMTTNNWKDSGRKQHCNWNVEQNKSRHKHKETPKLRQISGSGKPQLLQKYIFV